MNILPNQRIIYINYEKSQRYPYKLSFDNVSTDVSFIAKYNKIFFLRKIVSGSFKE